ncbi:MAG TPA: hypothetical protein VG604_03295 [Candidatus Saccharimonadales bacterium]|nr:hypothetical protein [Candidatus Saccharimonadales bacterium]
MPAATPAETSPVPETPGTTPVAADAASPVVMMGGDEPAAPAADSSAPASTPSPAAGPAKTGRTFKVKKSLLAGVVLAVVLVGGASAYYFGYYNSPSTIYSQSLKNTSKGYSKLIDYINQQSAQHYKGFTADGSYTLGAGSFATDGKLSAQSDGKSSDVKVDVNIGASRLGIEERSVSNAKSKLPDVFFKASGLKGLSKLAGTDLTSVVMPYDNQWIQVDQSLLQELQQIGDSSTGQSATNINAPTRAQVNDELDAFGKVNDQYVFTDDKTKAVFTLTKTVGKETVDGHSTYHYQVTPNKENLKKYITAQRDALKSSKLYGWITKNHYENYVGLGYDSLEQDVDNAKVMRPLDIWMDTSHRLIYKVRVSDPDNPSNNYGEFGLNYTGGSSYPFFVNVYDHETGDDNTSASFGLTLDSKTNSMGFNLNIKDTGTDNFSFKANLNAKPSNSAPAISAPTGAKSLTTILDQLGFGPYIDMFSSGSGTTDPSGDAQSSADLHHDCTVAEENYFNNGTPVPAKCDALLQ